MLWWRKAGILKTGQTEESGDFATGKTGTFCDKGAQNLLALNYKNGKNLCFCTRENHSLSSKKQYENCNFGNLTSKHGPSFVRRKPPSGAEGRVKQICLLEALSGKNRIPLTKTKSKEPAGHSPKECCPTEKKKSL